MPVGSVHALRAPPKASALDLYDAKLFPKTEVKLSIAAGDVKTLFAGLRLDTVKDVRHRRVVFFDTPRQELRNAGLLLRARIGDGDDDVTMKARGPTGMRAAHALRANDDAKPELDRTSRGLIPSVALSEDVSEKRIEDVIAGRHGARTLAGPEMERTMQDLLGRRPPWEKLQLLGPVQTTAWKLKPAGMSDDIVVELWRLPNGKQIVEISAKNKTEEGNKIHAELQALLRKLGVDPSNAQETKTQAVYDAAFARP